MNIYNDDDDDDDDDNDDDDDKNLMYIGRFFSLPNGYTIGCNRNGSDNVTHSDM